MTHPETREQGFKQGTPRPEPIKFNERRSRYFNIEEVLKASDFTVCKGLVNNLSRLDVAYRALCAVLFNYVPKSGHPGGSISSGRIVQSLMFNTMDYDISDPEAKDADHLSYAAGHKAMGLYAAWAMRTECVRAGNGKLLPDEKHQLRLEDLLGFRRNPTTTTPLYKKHNAKPLDGHPSPLVPFVRLATGASGVGVTSSVGLAFGMQDTYGRKAPRVHMLEGEGGMTPGRVVEAMAAAGTAQIRNIVMHLDWNQASIDSNHVCRDGKKPGDYVQWTPAELSYLHDWNVIYVPDGFDYKQVLAAQYLATHEIDNKQPTAIVYRTVKGWRYGIEGRTSHGAGHDFCSAEFYTALAEFENEFNLKFPRWDGEKNPETIEKSFFDCLMTIRKAIESNNEIAKVLTTQIEKSRNRLREKNLKPRPDCPNLQLAYEDKELTAAKTPDPIKLTPGDSATHRGVLGNILKFLNNRTGGAFVGSSADLFGSTSLSNLAPDNTKGFYNLMENPDSRLITIGGICEDAIGGFMAGLATYGNHVGVGSSYGAFIAALQHIPARLHAIGQEARGHTYGDAYNPFIIVCGHAGPKTGEDGPTHACPQALQLFTENFPRNAVITMTPWDTQEMWPLFFTALRKRPAVIAPFVTRPSETVVDRAKYNLSPAEDVVTGVYALRKADAAAKQNNGTVILQGNGVGNAFVTEVLPELDKKGLNLNVYYVASAELFDMLSPQEQEKILPEKHMKEAMGVTEFTLQTMYRWITSREGRGRTLHPFRDGHFLGSGQAEMVFSEGGLHGEGQLKAVLDYAKFIEKL